MMKSIQSFFVFVSCLFFSLSASGQINVKDSLRTVLRNDTIDAQTRFDKATYLISRNSLPEEAEFLAHTVVYPFVQKSWKSPFDQLTRLAQLHLMVGKCHRERGGDDRYEQERNFFRKALKTAKESGNDTIYSRCLAGCGYMEAKRGDVKKAHEYFYQAIEVYDKMGMYDRSTEMLYVIGLNFFQIKDVDGMQRTVTKMEPYLKKDKSKQTLYQYNVTKKMCIEMLLGKAVSDGKQVDYQLVDESISKIRNNIVLVENFHDELSPNWVHGWAYYYLSKVLYEYYPAKTDTIFHYLDKAYEVLEQDLFNRNLEASGGMELEIYIHQLRAQTLSRQGKMQEAYRFMNESLNLINELKNYQIFDEQYYVAYQFLVDYYEKINRPAEALKYQKLLQESEAQRYERKKIQAINDMSAKYETEKKEVRIQTLIEKHKTTQRTLWLIVGLSLALLTTLFLIILSGHLKRKNMEQKFYEMALLAELRQGELEKMQNLKQQLEQNPVENTIEKIAQLISVSLINKDDKKSYLERLSKMDSKLLENAYQTSKAKITGMDMKYIICFYADIDVKDISLLFNIEPASVHTVRYRIKKKFSKEDAFLTLLQ